MHRLLTWALRKREPRHITVEGESYLDRYTFRLWPRGWYLYVHHFRAGDQGRDVHDHPFSALSIVLCGGYTEIRLRGLNGATESGLDCVTRSVGAGRLNIIRAETFHRVFSVRPGTWTLLIRGPRRKRWGFLQSLGRVGQESVYGYSLAPEMVD